MPLARALATLFLGVLAITPAARAGNGALEISQHCATQTGCFTGDTAGFPITITQSGSYRLTSNLTITDPDVLVMSVDVDYVSIDLGGFAVTGPTTCAGEPPSTPLVCSPGGVGGAVQAGGRRGVSVRDGTVRGFGDTAVNLGSQAHARGLRVLETADIAIRAGQGSLVEDCVLARNGGLGISLLGPAIAVNNVMYENGVGGLAAPAALFASDHSVVVGNTAHSNSSEGFFLSSGVVAIDNVATSNGDSGMIAGFGSLVQGSIMRSNGDWGLETTTGSAFSENMFENNSSGTYTGPGVRLEGNLCNGNTTCP